MVRASWVLNRQLMVIWAAFRSRNRGPDFPLERVFVGEPLPQAGTGQYAELDFGQVQPTAVLRRVVEFQPFGNPPRLGCREGLVQGRHSVGVQVVQDHPDHWDLRVGFIHQPAHLLGEVLHRAPFSNRHLPPTRQRLAGQEPVAGALPPVLVVLPQRTPRLGRAARAGSRPATGLRSRQSRPPAALGHRARRTGPGRPPCGLRSRRLPGECTTPASATA